VANQDLWEAIDALARKTNGTQIHPIAKGSHPENVEWIGLRKKTAKGSEGKMVQQAADC
jgi:hypothetical protein